MTKTMAHRLNIDRVSEIQQNGGNNPVEEAVQAAGQFYCELYKNNPSWAIVKDNIILPVVTRSLDKICGVGNVPDPPPPPNFSGGQCPGIEYVITVEGDRGFGGITTPVTYTLVGYGEIRSIQAEFSPPEFPNVLAVMVRGEPGAKVPSGSNGEIVGGAGFTIAITSISVVRFDGLVDDCGDPPSPGYPTLPPPTDEDLEDTVTIINNNGDSFDYDVQINRDDSGTIVFPPVINVSGLSVVFDVGGVTVDNSKDTPSGGGNGDGGAAFEPEEEEEPKTTKEERLVAITISATGDLQVFDSTFGNGAPDAYYIGWVVFRNEEFCYPRIYINFLLTRFQAPEEVTDYQVTFREGWSGVVEEIIEEVEVPVEEPEPPV